MHLQYVNTETSSIYSIWEYWNIIIYIFNIEILNHHHLHLQYVNNETSSVSSVWEYWNIIIYIFSIEILKHHHLHIISYVEVQISMCYDGTQGCLSSQLWLSHRIIVVSISRSKRLDISFEIHMVSQLAEQVAMYSALAVLRETLDYFLLNHELIANPRQ